jgi:hypothetical protein
MGTAVWLIAPLLPGASPASGAVMSGPATIVGPGDTPVSSGDALHHPWYFNLPARASCPGDTAKQGYLTFSYAEPVVGGTAPGDIIYTPGGPPAPGTALVDINGSPYGPANTAIATSPGGPGQVGSPLPEFSWAPYVGSFSATAEAAKQAGYALHAGTWNIGIACANRRGQTTNYWNAQVRLSPPTATGDFAWTVVSRTGASGAPASPAPASSSGHAGSTGGTTPTTAGTAASADREPGVASASPPDPSGTAALAHTGRDPDGLLLLGLATVAAGWALTLLARTPWRAARRLTDNRRSSPASSGRPEGRPR